MDSNNHLISSSARAPHPSVCSSPMRISLLITVISIGVLGCSDTDSKPKPPAPTPSILDDSEDRRVKPLIGHLRIDRISGAWGNNPEIEWDAAITLGEMSKLAYEEASIRRQTLSELGFQEIELLDRGPKSGFIAIADEVAVIAFRGTDDPADWIANFDFRQLANSESARKVHSGFQRAYGSFASKIQEQLSDHKPKYVWITGHSLGGAMAACCAYDLIQNGMPLTALVTFGQPRVGNEALARYLDQSLGEKYLRFMNAGDPVVILPPCFGAKLPAYWHSGRRAWFLWDRLYTIEGPTLFAEPAPGAEMEDESLAEPGEATGNDEFESMTESEFLELQKELSASRGEVQIAGEPGDAATQSDPATSQGLAGGLADFFRDRIGDHNMDEYLQQMNNYRNTKLTK